MRQNTKISVSIGNFDGTPELLVPQADIRFHPRTVNPCHLEIGK